MSDENDSQEMDERELEVSQIAAMFEGDEDDFRFCACSPCSARRGDETTNITATKLAIARAFQAWHRLSMMARVSRVAFERMGQTEEKLMSAQMRERAAIRDRIIQYRSSMPTGEVRNDEALIGVVQAVYDELGEQLRLLKSEHN